MAKKPESPVQSSKPQGNTSTEKAPERLFLIKESALQQIFIQIQELPFRVAEPMLKYFQANLQEVKPDQVKEG